MSKRSQSFASNTAKLFSPTIHKSYVYPGHQPSEVKICEDCQVKHNSKLLNQSGCDYHDNQKPNRRDNTSNKDDLHYLSFLTHDMPVASLPTDNDEYPERNEMEYNQSPSGTSYANKESSRRNDFAFEKDTLAGKGSLRKSDRLFDRDDNMTSNRSRKNKNSVVQSPNDRSMRRQSPVSSYSQRKEQSPSGKKEIEFQREDELGEERFVDYARNFVDDLEKVSLKWESNIKNNFEKAAHNILYKQLNRQSLLDRDDAYRNREVRDHTVRENITLRTQKFPLERNENIENSPQLEKKYLNESQLKKEIDVKPRSPLKMAGSGILSGSGKKWMSPTQEDLGKSHHSFTKSVSFEDSVNNNKRTRGNESAVQKTSPSRIATKEELARKDVSGVVEGDVSNVSEGISIKKIGHRFKIQTQPVVKPDRFLLSSPGGDEGKSGLALKTMSGYEGVDDNELMKSLGISHIVKPDKVYDETESGVDRQSAEQRIEMIEETALKLIRDKKYDEALELLSEADMLIRNEIGKYHPKFIYIYYMLGECYLKKEDYYLAEKVIEKAVDSHEQEGDQFEKDSKQFCYYLGLLELQSRAYMLTRNYNIALKVYNKLLTGTEVFYENHDRQGLRGIVPHILLVKYNLAECFRYLEQLEQTDVLFYEVLSKYSKEEEELLENYSILFNIADYFTSRQQHNIALESLKKIAEITTHFPSIEKENPELFASTYDDIASTLFNRREYTESAYYYELAFKLKVKYLGIKHLKIGYALLALGKAYHLAGEYAKALHRFSAGLEIVEAFEGRITMYSANINLTMAKIHFELKEYGRSINLYERSLDIYSQILGSSHPYCLRIFANLVFVGFEGRDVDKVLQIAEKALKAVEDANNPDVFAMLNEIGNVYRKNEFNQEALQFYTLALKKFSKVKHSGISQEAVNLVYINMGSANFHLRKYGDALQYYKEAAKYFGELNNGVNHHIVSIYVNIIRLYKVMGRKEESGMYFKKASNALSLLERENAGEGLDETIIRLRNDLKVLKNT